MKFVSECRWSSGLSGESWKSSDIDDREYYLESVQNILVISETDEIESFAPSMRTISSAQQLIANDSNRPRVARGMVALKRRLDLLERRSEN
jgi:hypothetical protein